MITFTYTVTDEVGLHARPAGMLVKKAQSFPDEITLRKGDKTADAKRLFAVLKVGAKKGDEIEFTVSGDTEKATAGALVEFCAANI